MIKLWYALRFWLNNLIAELLYRLANHFKMLASYSYILSEIGGGIPQIPNDGTVYIVFLWRNGSPKIVPAWLGSATITDFVQECESMGDKVYYVKSIADFRKEAAEAIRERVQQKEVE